MRHLGHNIIIKNSANAIENSRSDIVVGDEEIIPKIKIYDPRDGGYFYRKIGFNSSIVGEDR